MAAAETGKVRASRIPYDYPLQSDRQVRQRLLVTAVLLAVSFAFVAWGLLQADTARRQLSPGHLSRAHATWETQCDACHVNLDSIQRAGNTVTYGINSSLGDEKCKACHMGHDSQVHHSSQLSAKTPHCAECHREHGGHEASLVRRDEAQCTSCHADLAKAIVHAPQTEGIALAIRHFYDGSHPEFRSASSDPGRLKFNHALHMSMGLNPVDDGQAVFTYRQLSTDAERRRFGWTEGTSVDAPVTLTCASCHVRDLSDFRLGSEGRTNDAGPRVPGVPTDLWPERPRGATMVPVVYELQCAACHPLDVPGPLRVPHRLQPNPLRESLRAGYLALLGKSDRTDALPEGTPRRIPWTQALDPTTRDELEQRVRSAERILFGPGKGTCTECHFYEREGGSAARGPDGRIDAADTRIAPTNLPRIWYEHARFDHTAHQAVNCRSCHPAAFPDGPDPPSKVSSDVLIPHIGTCVQCHTPRRRAGNEWTGGADTSCVECHTYHNGDHPRQGRGALARSAFAPADVTTFLRGGPIPEKPQVRKERAR